MNCKLADTLESAAKPTETWTSLDAGTAWHNSGGIALLIASKV